MLLSSPLAEALRERYILERELGHGGMAIVFLAHDLKHRRPVALKVLLPELGQLLGSERFLREVQTTARLDHPHIIPVFDSGEAAGLLWYTMPYVEGQTLRDKLRVEGQLTLEEAIRLTQEVADALDYAHQHGIVHRDIKPENILLAAGHARVADFGVARALAAAGAETITQTGMAVGTPAYMSPEQASDDTVDGRSDIYSLACVLFELLAGEPPHTGPTLQAVLGKRLAGPVPSVRLLRDTVPPSVDAALSKAMAKAPADRFKTAGEFSKALRQPHGPHLGNSEVSGAGVRQRLWTAAILVLGVATMFGLALYRSKKKSPIPEDPGAVAVLPFRVAGAVPELSYLREGMLDLLAAKLTGDGGPRAVDPRTVLNAWRGSGGTSQNDLARDEALAIARKVGASRAIQGSVVGSSARVVLTAEVIRSTGSSPPPVSVEGPLDSLSVLVDRLTASVLAGEAGRTMRLGDLASPSLPALKAYLDGLTAYRADRFEQALRYFNQALDLDSTFALAGIRSRQAAGWITAPERGERGLSLAVAARNRLSPRERLLLDVVAGPSYPGPSTGVEYLEAARKLAAAAPDQPEAHLELGDRLFHYGPMLSIDGWQDEARQHFTRAFTLDSSFFPAVSHLIDLAAQANDTAALQELGSKYLDRTPASDDVEYVRWRLALGLKDTAALSAVRKRFPTNPLSTLASIYQIGQYDGIGLLDVEEANRLWVQRAQTREERFGGLNGSRVYWLNRGRPRSAAHATAAALRLAAQENPRAPLYWRVLDAVYWDSDTADASAAVRTIAKFAEARQPLSAVDRGVQVNDICVLALWRHARRETQSLDQTIRQLQKANAVADPFFGSVGSVCIAIFEALRATAEHRADARKQVDALDSILGTGPATRGEIRQAGNLEAARMYQDLGEPELALRAVRRRAYFSMDLMYLSTALRLEGRLAELTGDRPGAIRAYQRYLALRSNAEPRMFAESEGIRRELAALLQED